MHSSAPMSNKSCWMSDSRASTSAGSASVRSTPIWLLSSSTSPRAWIRGALLGRRLPSPRPVVPSSPVRVLMMESRIDMAGLCGGGGGTAFGQALQGFAGDARHAPVVQDLRALVLVEVDGVLVPVQHHPFEAPAALFHGQL